MRAFLQFIARFMAGSSAAVLTWLISFFAFEQSFLLAGLYGLLGGGTVYFSNKQITHYRYLRSIGLSRREYNYIEQNLKEAKQKITRLQRALRSVGSGSQRKQNIAIMLTVRKIYSNTKKEPKRFYQAESFYYKHLDSLVALAEKYAYLNAQPSKTKEMAESLRDTRHTIMIMETTVKKDLYTMLNDDFDTLDFELDVARKSIGSVNKSHGRALK
ncbi:5-bromo-4-chloroindolyl phosphate hydrolysis family protein [Virgibacillus ainsalahensis]